MPTNDDLLTRPRETWWEVWDGDYCPVSAIASDKIVTVIRRRFSYEFFEDYELDKDCPILRTEREAINRLILQAEQRIAALRARLEEME